MTNGEKASVTLRLPSTLSAFSGGKSQIHLKADTVEQLLAALQADYPKIWQSLCTEDGQIREHVKIFVNNAMITSPHGLHIALKPGQEIIVLPSPTGV